MERPSFRSVRRHINEGPVQPFAHNDGRADEGSLGSTDEGSSQDTHWDVLDKEGISERVALFLASLQSKSNITFWTLNLVVDQRSDLIENIVEHLHLKTMAVLEE